MGIVTWRGAKCHMYQNIDQVGDKKSTYTFYVNALTKHPVHYEMFGYDTLIGSHFDKYTIDYYAYNEDPINATIFHVTDCKANIFLHLQQKSIDFFLFFSIQMHRISWSWS